MDRALASEASCWGFKSLQARQLQEYSGLEAKKYEHLN